MMENKHTIKKGDMEAEITIVSEPEHITFMTNTVMASFYFNEDWGDLMLCVAERSTGKVTHSEIVFKEVKSFTKDEILQRLIDGKGLRD